MMNRIVTITPSYQVHIPVDVRKLAGLEEHGPAEMLVAEGKIIIKPIANKIMNLAGKYRNKRKINIEKIREKIDYTKL